MSSHKIKIGNNEFDIIPRFLQTKKSDNSGYYQDQYCSYIAWSDNNTATMKFTGDSLTTGGTWNFCSDIVGDTTMRIFPQFSNEINFGGTATADKIYFGYRAVDNKPIPTKFIFGNDSGTATLLSNGFIKKDSSDNYVLTGGGGHMLISDFATNDHTHAASKITSGTFNTARIPNLDASKITTGTFDIARIPTGTTASTVAPGNHTHNYIATGTQCIELNTVSILKNYGGFIDFHYRNNDGDWTNDSGQVYKDANGNKTFPDYTSRIIEDAPGQISVNGVKFTNGSVYGIVTADKFVGPLNGNAHTATTATNLASNPSLAASGNKITVTAGNKTSSAFTVPYATSAGSATKLATARTLTIGNTGKTFDGSGNISWSVAEIGAAAAGHQHSFSDILPGNAIIGDGANYMAFRSTDAWRSGMYYHTNGDESMVFANTNNRSSWMFVYDDPASRPLWTEFNGTKRTVPSLQIRNQCVTINKLMPNTGSATSWNYNLDVGGKANATELYENGTRVSLSGHNHDDRYFTETEADGRYLKLTGGTLTGTTTISRDDATMDTMFYVDRTDLNNTSIGFGIGTSGNRGIYDAKAGGWILKVDTSNNVTFSGNAATASTASYIQVSSANDTNATYYVQFVNGTTGNRKSYTDGGLTFNPSTNTLATTQVNAKLNGPVQTTNTSTTASYYISFVNADATGARYSYISSELYFNPGRQLLTVPEVLTNVLEANHEVRLKYSAAGGGTTILLANNHIANNHNYINFPSNTGFVILSDSLSTSTSTSENRPVFIYVKGNEFVARKCTWGTSMTSETNYYLMGATSSTTGLVYNTNVKVYSNAIYASAGFYESSDERLKDFKEDIEVNFSYLHNIPKKYYSWKDDTTYTRHIGTSAQEVQKYYPELVHTDENGYLTMNYDKLSVVALKAIDVLHEEVTELKKENAELKERLARLEELILNR